MLGNKTYIVFLISDYTQLNNYYLSLDGLERECLALDCASGRAQIRPCDEENDAVCSDGKKFY